MKRIKQFMKFTLLFYVFISFIYLFLSILNILTGKRGLHKLTKTVVALTAIVG
jgi:hypothetical protein